MYMAYATRPTIVQISADWWRVIGWEKLGIVDSLEEAKKRYGGSPVLEAVKP